MMGRKFEKILKNKLYETKPPSDFIPDWNKFLEYKQLKEDRRKRMVIGIVLRLAAGFAILFGVGLGVYHFSFKDTISDKLAVVNNSIDETPDGGDSLSENNLPENFVIEPAKSLVLPSVEGISGKTESHIEQKTTSGTAKQSDTRGSKIDPFVPNTLAENNPDRTQSSVIGPISLDRCLKSIAILEKESIQKNETESARYDIDEYLEEFNELYAMENSEGDAYWSTALFANALASNIKGVALDKEYSSSYNYNDLNYFNSSYNQEAFYTSYLSKGNDYVIASADQSIYSKQLKHNPPINVSLTASYVVSPKIELSSGLVYSYLYSFYSEYRNFNSYSQKVHYLGIPVTVAYHYLPNKSKFNIYSLGGILVEKSLSASYVIKSFQNAELQEYEKEKIVNPRLMFSTNLGLGVGYEIINSFGLYAESYISYYVYNRDQPLTFKTAKPFSINLQLGIRYKFNANK